MNRPQAIDWLYRTVARNYAGTHEENRKVLRGRLTVCADVREWHQRGDDRRCDEGERWGERDR